MPHWIDAQSMSLSSHIRVGYDILCPTWRTIYHKGWRGFLIYKLRLPKKWFKPEGRTRVFYKVDDLIVCSPENYVWINEGIDNKP